jgi:hypothetical protein
MLLIYSYIFTFLDSVKAILVHRANRLLLESTLILRTLREQADGRTNAPVTSPGLRSIPEPHAFSTVVFYGVKFFAVKPRNSA